MPRAWLLPVLVLLAAPLPAQRIDSVAAARARMREAGAALQGGDTTRALARVRDAVQAWPRQGAYLLSLGRIATVAGDAATARDALSRAGTMGFGWSLAESAFARWRDDVAFRGLADSVAARTAPIVRGTVMATLADSLLHPEGIAWDATTDRLFVSSVHRRKIVVVEQGGRQRDFIAEGAHGLDAVFGLALDPARRLLWVATSATPEQAGYQPADSGRAAIMAFALDDGTPRGRWSLPADAPHLLGDVVLAPDGSAWASDSRTAGLWRVPAGAPSGAAERVPITSPDWVSLQGMAFSPDGRVLWLADWTTGLHRVDLVARTSTPVAADPALFTLGIDGLYRLGDGSLLAIQNGIAPARVVRLRLGEGGTRVTGMEVLDRNPAVAEEPTLGTPVPGGFAYVANSPWGHYGQDGRFRAGAPIPKGVVLRLPLP